MKIILNLKRPLDLVKIKYYFLAHSLPNCLSYLPDSLPNSTGLSPNSLFDCKFSLTTRNIFCIYASKQVFTRLSNTSIVTSSKLLSIIT